MSFLPPDELYSALDLREGFEPDDPIGFTKTFDFQQFRQYIIDGGETPSLDVQLQRAEHDARIASALRSFLDTNPEPKLVGFMGGHKLLRDGAAYALVARLARELTRKGFLVVSGGGPGAMEATHLGAAFAHAKDRQMDDALMVLAERAALPKLGGMLDKDGEIKPGLEPEVREAHLWFKQALAALRLAPEKLGTSLAIPTWHYGHEPTCPFATHYAKYYLNSIREEALVTEARAGIVYARGASGTVREIFQDAEQNFYVEKADDFTPMIFFDPEGYWQREATYNDDGTIKDPGIKIDHLLKQHLKFGRAGRGEQDLSTWQAKVAFTTDFTEIEKIIAGHAVTAQKNLVHILRSDPTNLALATWNRVT